MAYWDQVHLNTGQKASLVLHGGLIGLVLVFDLFQVPDSPMIPDVTEVAIISARDFEAMTQPSAPVPAPEPQPPEQAIQAPAPIEAPQPQARPEPIAPPAPLTPPEPETPAAPAVEPEPPQAAVVAPVVTPDADLTPVQPDAERIAPEPAPAPEPEVAIAPRDQAAITPDADATVDAPESQDAAQREAAATETVTENTRISEDEPARRTATAPEVSLTPRRRPARPVQPAPEPAEEPALIAIPDPQPAPAEPEVQPEAQGPSASDIENALAEALGGAPSDAPAALSQADADMIRLAIQSNWNLGALSTDAMNVDLTIAFEMTPDSRPIPSSIHIVQAFGGSAAAQQAAFEAGRQAILRAGENGFGLPPESYDTWRYNEYRFNPSGMITR